VGRAFRRVQRALAIRPQWKIERYFQKYAVVRGHWKLIRSTGLEEGKRKPQTRYELYDLEADPLETRDRSAEEEVVFRELKAVLAEFVKERRIMKVLPEERRMTEEERQRQMRELRSLGYMQ
jgi:hypothetical protein